MLYNSAERYFTIYLVILLYIPFYITGCMKGQNCLTWQHNFSIIKKKLLPFLLLTPHKTGPIRNIIFSVTLSPKIPPIYP